MKSKSLFLLTLLCLAMMITGARAGSAQQVQPLEPEWLLRMYEEGWQKVQEGVLQRDAAEGDLETFSYGAEGLQWVMEGYEQQLSFFEEKYSESPSDELVDVIERLHGEIDALSGDLGAAPSAEAFDGGALAECTEVAYGGQASAGPVQSPRGVTAAASAYFHTNCTGYIGDTFAVAYAEAIDGTVHTVKTQDDPKRGTWIDSQATASAPGSTVCYSWAQASVTMNGGSVFQTPLKENYACPLPVRVTITGPAVVNTDYYGATCVDVTWTTSVIRGNPAYTLKWYIGTSTTVQGTGTTLTKRYCNTDTAVTVKAVATDTLGWTDDATFTTDVQYIGLLTATVSGPGSAATNSTTPCADVTWTASATGAHPGYTYSWFLGTSTTVQGTGSTFTKRYCSTTVSVTVKVVARDADGHTDDATRTTSITHTSSPPTALINGPSEVVIATLGECKSISWTASATGGAPVYSYRWYIGTSTTVQGTGSTLTKTFCGVQTINIKVTALDSSSPAQSDDATFTTTVYRELGGGDCMTGANGTMSCQ